MRWDPQFYVSTKNDKRKEKKIKMRKMWLCLQSSEKNFGGKRHSGRFVGFLFHSRNLSYTDPFRKFRCDPVFISVDMLLEGGLKTVRSRGARG